MVGQGILFYVAARLASFDMPLSSAASKRRARHLLEATVFYLPLLFVLMVTNSGK
jgi:hypothetical protein